MKKRSGIALLLVGPALAFGACGGDSDKDKITSLVEDVSDDPAKLCDNATKDVLKQIGGEEGCRKVAKGAPKPSEVKVESVDVKGDKATAKVTAKTAGKSESNDKIEFVKEDGDWKFGG